MKKNNLFVYKNNCKKYNHVKSRLVIGELSSLMPLVSIVIPTYKRGDLLNEALNSAINQEKFDNYEVVIVDNEAIFDKETKTEKIVKLYKNNKKVFYYKNDRNIGMTGNWNRAIELARGEWITMLHDDDILYPTFLYSMEKILTNNSYNFIVNQQDIGDIYTVKDPECNTIELKLKKIRNITFGFSNISPVIGILFKKDIFEKVGGFNEKFYPSMDYAFWVKYCLNSDKAYITNQKVGFYRKAVSESNKKKTALIMAKKDYEIKRLTLKALGVNKVLTFYILFIVRNSLGKYLKYSKNVNIKEIKEVYKKNFNTRIYFNNLRNKSFFKIINYIIKRFV